MKKSILPILLLCTAFYAISQTGHSLHFDGIDDIVTINSYTDMSPTDAVTISAWIKTPGVSANTYIYDRVESNDGFGLIIRADGTIRLTINGGKLWVTSSTTVDDEEWHHVAGTYDRIAGVGKVYIDGAEDNYGLYSSAITYIPEPRNNIGGGHPYTSYFNGLIDDLMIWSVARTPSQILLDKDGDISYPSTDLIAYWNFDQGTPCGDNTGEGPLLDYSGNGNDGTLYDFDLTGGCSSNFVLSDQETEGQIIGMTGVITDLLVGGTINFGQFAGLIDKLESIKAKIDAGQTNAACNQLQSFLNQIDGINLSDSEKISLTSIVSQMMLDLGCNGGLIIGNDDANNFEIGQSQKALSILGQNYPNPFSMQGQSTIPIYLNEEDQVKLSVYDLNGRLVTMLLNDVMLPKGSHEVVVLAGQITAGIYYYRLRTNSFESVKKMVVTE